MNKGAPASQQRSTTAAASVGIASIGGALIAVQILVNGALTAIGAGPVLAAWLSYLGTLASAIVVILVAGRVVTVFSILRGRSRRPNDHLHRLGRSGSRSGNQRGVLHRRPGDRWAPP